MHASQEISVGRSPIPGEFEDGSYVPVRGLSVLIARTASGRPSLGSQHPRSPTNCFDRDHRSTASPRPCLAAAPVPVWAAIVFQAWHTVCSTIAPP